MTSFDKLVDQVDNAVFQSVSDHLVDAMGGSFDQESHDTHSLVTERILVALLKKYRPENVIFVEDEEEVVPTQIIYGVFNADNEWICDVSGITEGELADDLEDALEDDAIVFDLPFEIGQEIIRFVNKFDEEWELRRQ
jgi:hypothetical protein